MADSDSDSVALETLFAPCTRYRHTNSARYPLVNLQGFELSDDIEELELTERGAEILLNGTFELSELKSFVQVPGRLVWLGPDALLLESMERTMRVGGTHYLQVSSWSNSCAAYTPFLFVGAPPAGFQGSVACDRFLNLFSVSLLKQTGKCRVLIQGDAGVGSDTPVSAGVLSQLVEDNDSSLTVSLSCFKLDEDQCQALATVEEAHIDVELEYCTLTEAGKAVVFDGIRNNRGLSSIKFCNFDLSLLFDALQGNDRVNNVTSYERTEIQGASGVVTMQSLGVNLGLVELSLQFCSFDDDSWSAMCHSLESHLKLKRLVVAYTCLGQVELSCESKARRIQSIVDMLRVNKVIASIELPFTLQVACLLLWAEEIYPRLELNKYRPLIRAVKRTQGPMREPLVGRALYAVNDNASLVFMLLVGTADVDWVAQLRTRRSRKRVRYSK